MNPKSSDNDRKSTPDQNESQSQDGKKTVTYRFGLGQIRNINISMGEPTGVIVRKPPVSPEGEPSHPEPPEDSETSGVVVRKPPGFIEIVVGPDDEDPPS